MIGEVILAEIREVGCPRCAVYSDQSHKPWKWGSDGYLDQQCIGEIIFTEMLTSPWLRLFMNYHNNKSLVTIA